MVSMERIGLCKRHNLQFSTVECQECLRCTFDGTGAASKGAAAMLDATRLLPRGVGGVSDSQGEGQASVDSTYQGSGTLQWSSSLRP